MMDALPNDADCNEADLTAWQRAYRSLQAPRSCDCLRAEQFLALVLEAIHGAARTRLADHIVRCQRCTDVYQVLLRLPPPGA
jgi:hypothetical protein